MAVRLLADRYRLEARLGGGGMSVVWRAYDEVLRQRVAVKVVSPRRANAALARQRIRTEASAATRLNHPNITKVLDYSYLVGAPYLVMELLDGETLAERMRVGRLPMPDVLEICAQVADALAAAHAIGVVHRDIKPGNIMLTPAGVKVMDFGIAGFVSEADESGPPADPGGSVPDSIWGTAAYVAPERLMHNRVLPASDVYALGVLMYRALTGQRPWPAVDPAELLAAHVSADPALLPADAGVPPEVVTLCERCLAKDPRQRPTARETATVLAAAAASAAEPAGAAAVAVAPPRSPQRHGRKMFSGPLRGRPAALAGSAGLLVAMASVLSFCALTGDSGQQLGAEAGPAPARPSVSPQPDSPSAPPSTGPPSAGPATPAKSPGGFDPQGVPEQEVSPAGAGSEPAAAGPGGGVAIGDGSGRGGGDPAPSGPAPSPTPDGPPTTTSPPPPVTDPTERTLSTVAGTVVARCEGRTASLVSWEPQPGYQVAEVSPGPDVKVEIVFRSQLDEITLTVQCRSGVPKSHQNRRT